MPHALRVILSRLINAETIPGWGLVAAGVHLWRWPELFPSIAGLDYLAQRPSGEFWLGMYIIVGMIQVLYGAAHLVRFREVAAGAGVACWVALAGALLVRSPSLLATALAQVLAAAMIRAALFPNAEREE